MRRLPILIFIACLWGLVGACAEKEPPPTPPEPVRPVKVFTIPSNISSIETKVFSGVAKGIEEITLSFRVAGVLQTLPAKVGDKKKKGDVLGTLDKRDFILEVRNLEGQLKTAEAEMEVLQKGERPENVRKLKAQKLSLKSTLRTAELEYERVQQLYVNDAASKARLDQANSDLDLAKANLDVADQELIIATTGARKEDIRAHEAKMLSTQAKLDRAIADQGYTILYMPFNGVIAKRHVSNFEQIRQKQKIFDASEMDRIEVIISISDSMIANVKRGQPALVEFLPLRGKKFSGKVTKVGLSADRSTLTFPVWVEVPNPKKNILPGMPAEVALKLPRPGGKSVLLPIDTVLENKVSGEKFVWVVAPSDQTATPKPVHIGDLVGNLIEITGGLESGDVIITAGLDQLSEGMKVRPLDAPPSKN